MTDALPQFPLLSAAGVQTWSGASEVKKGRSYVRPLALLTAEPVNSGCQLGGTTYGTETYQVRATLKRSKVAQANCSCPVGRGGECKHTAALLTRYSESPADFQHLAAVSALLEPLSTEQLRGVIG